MITKKNGFIYSLIPLILTGCGLRQNNLGHDISSLENSSSLNTLSGLGSQDLVREFNSHGFFELNLDHIRPKVMRKYAEVKLTDVHELKHPKIVNLDNIEIIGNRLFNQTPYSIRELYLRGRGTAHVIFSKPLPPYSSGKIADYFNGYTVTGRPSLSSSSLQFFSDLGTNDLASARFANKVERETLEHFLIYDQYMFNSPLTYQSVERFFFENCEKFLECKNSEFGLSHYVRDMYYAKAVSNVHTHLIVDPTRWANASVASMSLTTAYSESDEQYISLNPNLLSKAYSTDKSVAIDTWQAMAHVYYHNHGFNHDHGWASRPGIDDVFGYNVLEHYIEKIGNSFVIPNVIMRSSKGTERGSYELDIMTNGTSDGPLVLRVLSTSMVSGRIVQSESSLLKLEFDEIPENDVYLSVYTADGTQMFTLVLALVKRLTSQDEMNLFPSHIHSWLKDYELVEVRIDDEAWRPVFDLPSDKAFKGKKVRVTSQATYAVDINDGKAIDPIQKGERRLYTFDGLSWNQESE